MGNKINKDSEGYGKNKKNDIEIFDDSQIDNKKKPSIMDRLNKKEAEKWEKIEDQHKKFNPDIKIIQEEDTIKNGRPSTAKKISENKKFRIYRDDHSSKKEEEKPYLYMRCNEYMAQFFLELKRDKRLTNIYFSNLNKTTIYIMKIIEPILALDMTKRKELFDGIPPVPQSLTGGNRKGYRINKDLYDDIAIIAGFLNTSFSNAATILSYISMPIEFYDHFPNLIKLYENIEETINRYYLPESKLKLNKLIYVQDAYNKQYNPTSDIRTLLHALVELHTKFEDEIKEKIKNNPIEFDEDYRSSNPIDNIGTIISLLNIDNPTFNQESYSEHIINDYWSLLVDNCYIRGLKYW